MNDVFCPVTKEKCKREKCGWWNQKFQQCAIWMLGLDARERVEARP